MSAATESGGQRLPYLISKLKTPGIAERLDETAAAAREQKWSFEQFLEALLEAEVYAREAWGPATGSATPPFQPTRRSRTSTSQLSRRPSGRCACTSPSSPGSQSTPTSASSGHRVAFATAQQWIDRLEAAQHSNSLDDELRLERYGLLVVDEIGYLPLERQAANLLFALVARRYERGSIIVISNRGFEAGRSTRGAPRR